MNVIEAKKPQLLLIPDIQQLLKRSVEKGLMLAPAGFDSVAEDLFEFIKDDDKFMFLGAEEGTFKAVVFGFFPHGRMFPYPTVVNFYNEGSRALSRAMGDVLMDFIVANGYTRILAVNGSGAPDDVWLRALTPADAKSSLVGTLAQFEVK